MATQVTDPALLSQLEGQSSPVTDPALLAALNGPQIERTNGGMYHYRDANGTEHYSRSAPGIGATPVAPASPLGNNYENFMAGAGKSVIDTGRGLHQLYANAADYLAPKGQSRSAGIQSDIDESRANDSALMGTGSGVLGNIAGTVAQGVAGGSLLGAGARAAQLPRMASAIEALTAPNSIRSAAAAGALQGGAAPVASDESRIGNAGTAALFGGGGQGVASGLARIAQPVAKSLDPVATAYIEKLKAAGVPLDVAQQTGNEFLQRVKSGLSRFPITAGWAHDQSLAQRTAVTRAMLRTVGESSDHASPEVMSAARDRIGQVFNDASARGASLDGHLIGDIQDVQHNLNRTVPESSRGPINAQISDILESAWKNGGKIDGSILQRVNSDLGNMTRNSDYGTVAADLRRAVVNATSRNSTPEQQAALTEARVQYRNLKQIEQAVKDQQISPALVANIQRRKANIPQGVYGKGDQELGDLARAAHSVLPESIHDSGTPSGHAALATIGAGGAIAAPLLYAGGHSFLSGEPIDPEHIGEATKRSAEVAGLVGAMIAAKKGFGSKAVTNYLSNGVPSPVAAALLKLPQKPVPRYLLNRALPTGVLALKQAELAE